MFERAVRGSSVGIHQFRMWFSRTSKLIEFSKRYQKKRQHYFRIVSHENSDRSTTHIFRCEPTFASNSQSNTIETLISDAKHLLQSETVELKSPSQATQRKPWSFETKRNESLYIWENKTRIKYFLLKNISLEVTFKLGFEIQNMICSASLLQLPLPSTAVVKILLFIITVAVLMHFPVTVQTIAVVLHMNDAPVMLEDVQNRRCLKLLFAIKTMMSGLWSLLPESYVDSIHCCFASTIWRLTIRCWPWLMFPMHFVSEKWLILFTKISIKWDSSFEWFPNGSPSTCSMGLHWIFVGGTVKLRATFVAGRISDCLFASKCTTILSWYVVFQKIKKK